MKVELAEFRPVAQREIAVPRVSRVVRVVVFRGVG
jgi:hypothetical protein